MIYLIAISLAVIAVVACVAVVLVWKQHRAQLELAAQKPTQKTVEVVDSNRLLNVDVDASVDETAEEPDDKKTAARTTVALPDTKKKSKQPTTSLDSLTNLLDRRSFAIEMQRLFKKAKREKTALSLMLIDLDNFRFVNEHHGDKAGDWVLKQLGRIIRDVTDSDAVAARYGGEEFSILLSGVDLLQIAVLAERIAQRAKMALKLDWSHLETTLSIGIATMVPGENSLDLLLHADLCLTAAKASGRNCIYYFNGRAPALYEQAAIIGDENNPALKMLDRRVSRRATMGYKRRIAPYAGSMPPQIAFRSVECNDLSCGGFSFTMQSPPTSTSIVVALGEDPDVLYVIAEVVSRREMDSGDFQLGCRFTGRLDAKVEELAV